VTGFMNAGLGVRFAAFGVFAMPLSARLPRRRQS